MWNIANCQTSRRNNNAASKSHFALMADVFRGGVVPEEILSDVISHERSVRAPRSNVNHD